MNTQAKRIAEMIVTGLTYANVSIQEFWSAKMEVLNDRYTGRINMFSENNLTLHVSRSFAENGFFVWSEVPFYNRNEGKKSDLTLDSLAYDKGSDIAVMFELKNNIDTPQGVFKDIVRFVELQQEGHGLCRNTESENGMRIHNAKHKFYVIITVLNRKVFTDWWKKPKREGEESYMPSGRSAPLYDVIGQILNGFSMEKDCRDMGAFGCSAAYALFSAEQIETLSQSEILQKGNALLAKSR